VLSAHRRPVSLEVIHQDTADDDPITSIQYPRSCRYITKKRNRGKNGNTPRLLARTCTAISVTPTLEKFRRDAEQLPLTTLLATLPAKKRQHFRQSSGTLHRMFPVRAGGLCVAQRPVACRAPTAVSTARLSCGNITGKNSGNIPGKNGKSYNVACTALFCNSRAYATIHNRTGKNSGKKRPHLRPHLRPPSRRMLPSLAPGRDHHRPPRTSQKRKNAQMVQPPVTRSAVNRICYTLR
jgi:hypothetical protein